MNDLEKYFSQNTKRLIWKWNHYFDIYDRHFSRFRGKEIAILEIGVWQGGSLQMWRDYFGDKAKIYGVDIDPRCKAFEEENIQIFTGSQSDRKFLRELVAKLPPLDIVIDDGGHSMNQQIVSFEELFGAVKSDGVYLCEDIHTSYWLNFGGGHKRRGTFIEYSKNFIDSLHAFHSEQKSFKVDEITRSVRSLNYYDSIVVLEKQPIKPPTHEMKGEATFGFPEKKMGIHHVVGRFAIRALNEVLRFFRLGSVFY